MKPLDCEARSVADAAQALRPGEAPLPHAPAVILPNGERCIPQHYLRYQHDAHTLQALVADIHCHPGMPLFAGADEHGLYLQVGVIGRENYDRGAQARPRKLVYGRKWRIESWAPTSEVIQTALLAFKKAREHELRELLTLRDGASGRISAPFSCHHDLPLMADNPGLLRALPCALTGSLQDRLQHLLAPLRFGERPLQLIAGVEHRGRLLVDLRLGEAPAVRRRETRLAACGLPEFDGLELHLQLREASRGELMYELMDALIRHGDRLVDEQFRYRGFPRFSRELDPLAIARLSIASRPNARDLSDARFSPVFQQSNAEIDAARVPSLGSGELARRNRECLAHYAPLIGFMPQGY